MQTELTLMAVPSRNISLPVLRKHVEQRMTQNLKFLTEDKDDTEDKEHLTQLCNTLDGMCHTQACLPVQLCTCAAPEVVVHQ